MKFEQYHRRSKLTSNVSGSFKNIVHTLAHKCQLKLCFLLLSPLKEAIEYPEGVAITDSDHQIYFKNYDRRLLMQSKCATINGTVYKRDMVVVIKATDTPVFGLINKIFVFNNKICYFVCNEFVTLYFHNHYYAYEVEKSEKKICVDQTKLHDFSTAVLTRKQEKLFVSFKYGL